MNARPEKIKNLYDSHSGVMSHNYDNTIIKNKIKRINLYGLLV